MWWESRAPGGKPDATNASLLDLSGEAGQVSGHGGLPALWSPLQGGRAVGRRGPAATAALSCPFGSLERGSGAAVASAWPRTGSFEGPTGSL